MLNVEQIRAYCLLKKGVSEGFPFDTETLVFKVANKMFALMSLDSAPLSIALKCDPERAIELRSQFDGTIVGAYHMNKKHWNGVTIDGTLPHSLVWELIDHSYDLIVAGLKKSERAALESDTMGE
jgi:predicted DNA-binding protein (MmcQ/YjbR family)